MRSLVVLGLALSFVSCDNNNSSQQQGNDMSASTGQDMAGSTSHDMANAGGGQDLSGSDLTGGGGVMDLGGAGAKCTTACDCMPGLACFNNQCVAGVAAVYCCSSATCPTGDYCQNTSGSYGMCGGGGFMFDLAGFDVCPNIKCTQQNNPCSMFGCTMCNLPAHGSGVCAK
jgi:hypothetical protein